MKTTKLKAAPVTLTYTEEALEITLLLDLDQAEFLERTGCSRYAVESITGDPKIHRSIEEFLKQKSDQWEKPSTREDFLKGVELSSSYNCKFAPTPTFKEHSTRHRKARSKVKHQFYLSEDAWGAVLETARFLEITPEDWCVGCFGHRHFLGR